MKEIDTILESIRKFEARFNLAIEDRFKSEPENIKSAVIDSYLNSQIDLEKFYRIYKAQQLYQQDNLEQLMNYVFDIKLEQYFIEVDIASYNDRIYLPHQNESVSENPRLQLVHLSIDQSIILKSRISWERFMNFIYYLEKDKSLGDEAYSRHLSNKTVFKNDIIKVINKWKFLEDHLRIIEKFDIILRNPETHSKSALTKYFMESTELDSDIILSVTSITLNLWNAVILILEGGAVIKGSWNIGMDKLEQLELSS